jgi:RHS repeat-associated protein
MITSAGVISVICRKFCHFAAAGLLLVTAPLASYAACQDEPTCFECNAGGVHFGGGAYENRKYGTCSFVFRVASCNSAAMACVFDPDCCAPRGSGQVWTWSIEGSGLGLKIENDDVSGGNWATISPAGDFDRVSPGAITVVATKGDAKRSGSLFIEVEECTDVEECTNLEDPEKCDENSLGNTSAANGSIAARFALGRCAFGKTAGLLQIKETTPMTALCTPACLKYRFTNLTECKVVTNANGIYQVRVPEGLAHVVTNSAYKYSICMYPVSGITATNGDGTYQVSGAPLRTITVENPDTSGATTNRLRITDGEGRISDYEWKTNGWELTRGGGLRKEFKTSVLTNSIRTITSQVRDQADTLVSVKTNRYQIFSFGEKLIEQTVGSGAAAQSTLYTYYTNTASVTGLLYQVQYPGGAWEINHYDTNQMRREQFLSFSNQAPTTNGTLCRRTTYDYGSNVIAAAGDAGLIHPDEPRQVVEYLLGQEISRTYAVWLAGEKRDIRCVHPGAAWNNSSNLVTTTRWSTNTTNNFRRKISVERPDGTMDIYQYGVGSNRTNTVLSGEPNGGKTDIVNGTKTIQVLGPVGQMVSIVVIDIASGITISQETYSDYDSYNRPRKVTYLDGTYTWTDHGCCGPIMETNREGTVVYHLRDALNRQAAVAFNSITNTNVLSAVGHVLQRVRIGSDGSAVTNAIHTHDTVGRLLSSQDAVGNTTYFSEMFTNNQISRAILNPDGGTRVEEYYRDGQLARVTGSAVYGMRYEHGVEQDGAVWRLYAKEIKLDAGGNDTPEWTKTYRDMVGRRYKTIYADGAAQERLYDSKGQMVRQIDLDGVTTLYGYNSRGELEVTALDMNRNGIIDYNGIDRIQQQIQSVTSNNGFDVRQARSYRWSTNNTAVSNLIGTVETSTDGLRTWNNGFGLTNKVQTTCAGSGIRYETNTAPDGSYTVNHYQHKQLLSVTRKDASGNQLGKTTYGYDAHGRLQTATDARTGTTTYAYDNADRKVSEITPSPGTGQNAQKTSYGYDFGGRIIQATLPDGGVVYSVHSTRGELLTNYGVRVYPVSYAFDHQGRKTNMVTWTNFAARTGAAITTWKYDGLRGFMTNKVYADGNGPSYTYTPGGKLRTRKWARGVTTMYNTNAADDIISITYSDGTSNITYNLDRLGRRTNIIDAAGNRFLSYTDSGQLLLETNASGLLVKMNISYGYDSLQRRTSVTVRSNTATVFTHSYSWNSASQLTNVSDGTYQADYGYLANSPLVSQITFRSNSAVRMTTTKKYDFLNRLREISSVPSASSAVKFSYDYNDANQRVRRVDSDASYWFYEYDSLSQIAGGNHYWEDGSLVAGQQFEYAYDDIGNRRQTREGGDAAGAGLRSANYTVNNLNQYTQRDVPGTQDIVGIAHPNASTTVNNQSTYRRGEYYHKELPINNMAAVVWQSVTNRAIYSGQTNTEIGNLLIPKTPQSFWYDVDGNMLSDFAWTNSWDGENHLAVTENTTAVPTTGRSKEAWTYDSEGRWVQRIVYSWTGGTYAPQFTNRLLWDGKVLLAMLDRTNGSVMSFMRGIDLSGSLQGAGGAGGLLSLNSGTNGVHFCAFDGRSDVVMLTSAQEGSVSGRYEYDPCGRLSRVTGTSAKVNPLRSGIGYFDDVTRALKYLYRDFEPTIGRWMCRDAIGEKGGINLYNYVGNDPVNFIDIFGMAAASWRWSGGGDGRLVPSNVDDGGTTVVVWEGIADALEGRIFLPGCKGYVIDTGGSGALDYYYSNEKIRQHELVHVGDRTQLWADYKTHALSYENICFCTRAQADCLASLIKGKMADLYLKRGDLKGAAFDCKDYPQGSQKQKEACAKEKTLTAQVNQLQSDLSVGIRRCLLKCP